MQSSNLMVGEPVPPSTNAKAARKRIILSLAELLPEPATKRRRTDVSSQDGEVLFGDRLRISKDATDLFSQERRAALTARASDVEFKVRAALPHVFGKEDRERYEERTGNFCAPDAASQETEEKLKGLMPHLFGNTSGLVFPIEDRESLDQQNVA
eukprot:TRINITY_DN28090_c0_g1_i1.p1 TRINITY_DN28090_c0_g1~~TRINITY_DN28090_c0_g1_i1.p1  ORF type:complete len:155 (+),score=29.95 TRINITY_DN28090_c0_g1_i1:32-496(+)